MKLRHKMAPF